MKKIYVFLIIVAHIEVAAFYRAPSMKSQPTLPKGSPVCPVNPPQLRKFYHTAPITPRISRYPLQRISGASTQQRAQFGLWSKFFGPKPMVGYWPKETMDIKKKLEDNNRLQKTDLTPESLDSFISTINILNAHEEFDKKHTQGDAFLINRSLNQKNDVKELLKALPALKNRNKQYFLLDFLSSRHEAPMLAALYEIDKNDPIHQKIGTYFGENSKFQDPVIFAYLLTAPQAAASVLKYLNDYHIISKENIPSTLQLVDTALSDAMTKKEAADYLTKIAIKLPNGLGIIGNYMLQHPSFMADPASEKINDSIVQHVDQTLLDSYLKYKPILSISLVTSSDLPFLKKLVDTYGYDLSKIAWGKEKLSLLELEKLSQNPDQKKIDFYNSLKMPLSESKLKKYKGFFFNKESMRLESIPESPR